MAEAIAYQFRIALRQISPKIWRRLQLLSTQSLADLHFSIQVVMGWTDEFQHRFVIRNHRLGISRPGGLLLFGNPSEMRLEQFEFREYERFTYEYNFNDEWELEIRFEGAITADPRYAYPRCAAGAQRAPAEDCGGSEHFMERWQADPKQIRATHDRRTVTLLVALVKDHGLDAQGLVERAREILSDRPPASFNRVAANGRLQQYSRSGHLTDGGGEE
ncbi:MAG: plasmid pRiA4b ORF-3 family protein [Steroidobacteraceae bacterium]